MKKGIFVLAWVVLAGSILLQWNATKNTVVRDTAFSDTSKESTVANISDVTPKEEEPLTDIVTKEETNLETQDTAIEEEDFLENGYAYGKISEAEKKVYEKIYQSLSNMESETTLPTKDAGTVEKVFNCVLMDHPEIFYVDGYKYTEYSTGAKIHRLTFTGNYIYDKEEVESRLKQIEATASRFLADISAEMSDYEKIKRIYETIILQTDYDLNAPDNQNICSVLISHDSVCQGYAKALQYLLQKVDIPSTLVVGTVQNGEGHAWNLVRADGSFYYVDATWGDAYYLFGEDQGQVGQANRETVNYDYLLVTTDQLLQTHKISTVIDMPICVDMTDNYYVKEGLFFTSYDHDRVGAIFQQAKENGKESVTLKCSDASVYEDMKRKLLDEQEIFEFLQGGTQTVTYTDSEQQRSLSFWL